MNHASDRTNLILDLEYLNDERPSDSGLVAIGRGVADVPFSRIIGEPDDVIERNFVTTGYELAHDFSDNWQLRNAFRYSSQHYDASFFLPLIFNEASGLALRLGGGTQWYQDYLGVQTDLVGEFSTGSIDHTLLFGADYSRSRANIDARINIPAPANLSPLNLFNPTYGLANRLPFDQQPALARVQDVTTSRFGLFVQDQIDFSDEISLVAGVRYDTTNQDVINAVSLFDPAGRTLSQSLDAIQRQFWRRLIDQTQPRRKGV